MRRLKLLGVGVAVMVGLIGAVPTASAAVPADKFTIIGPIVDTVDCSSGSLTRTESGWLALGGDLPDYYHLTWTYSPGEGKVWSYIDTGLIRTFERDGDVYVSLSGRSVNVGPDGTGWVGHFEVHTFTSEVWRAGLGVGEIDQLACTVLGLSS